MAWASTSPVPGAGGRGARLGGAYLVQRATHVDGAVLNHLVHDIRDGLHEIRVGELDCSERKRNTAFLSETKQELFLE